MSKFDELKKLAQTATQGPWVLSKYGSVMADATNCIIVPAETGMQDNLFIAAANPAAILELLAIQAQLVKALRQAQYAIKGREHTGFIDAALASAGAEP